MEDSEFSCSVLAVQALEEAAFIQSFAICPVVPQKDKACCPYGIDIPEVLICRLCQVSEMHRGWVPSVQKYFLCSASSQSSFWTVMRCCQDRSQVSDQVCYWVSYQRFQDFQSLRQSRLYVPSNKC